MRHRPTLLVCTLLLAGLVCTTAGAATLEVPANGGDASGVGYFSGWKCPPNDNVTLVIDGGAPIPVATGVRRSDTAGACGNDGRNGFISQYNFNLLGDGAHTVSVRRNGVQFAQATFNVTTFGQSFMRGATGTYQLPNFPEPGRNATIEWVEGAQSFVVVGKSGGGTPSQCPSNGPITNLLLDCSDFGYLYVSGSVAAALSSDGEVAAICTVAAGDPDVLCFGGPVQSATTFRLIGANLNGGPVVPLEAGSSGSIGNAGRSLSFTVVLDGEVFPFIGFTYSDTEPLAATDAATGSDLGESIDRLREALANAPEAGTSVSVDGDAAALQEALGAILDHALP